MNNIRVKCIFGILLTLIFLFTISSVMASAPQMQWYKTFGGSYGDGAYSVQQTTDGGYILAGYTESYGSGGVDVYLIKTDSSGNQQWYKTFGGSYDDSAASVQQTTDGGYIIAGYTYSYSSTLYADVYLIKTDSSGIQQWFKTFGGSYGDWAYSVQQTTDGGYIIVGGTSSYGSNIGSTSYADVYLIKTDSSGNQQWYKTFGGSSNENGYMVQQTSDGGYILAGYTESYGSGGVDVYLIKTDSSGNQQWYKTFGGSYDDDANSVQQTTDGGYLMAGFYSYSSGSYDAYLVKTASNGNLQWQETFGGSSNESAFCVQQTTDGGCILTGWTNSYGSGGADAYLVKTYEVVDTTPPTVSSQSPANGAIIATSRPTISATFSDSTGVDSSSVVIKLDGTTITGASITATGFSYTPSSSLSDGSHTVYISVADTLGNTDTSTWTFTVDTTPPTISSQSPANGTLTIARPTISATFSDNIGVNPYSTTIKLDGVTITGASITATGFSYTPPTPLSDGSHTISVSVRDTAGNIATSTITFTVDTTPPTISSQSPANDAILVNSRPTISATFFDATEVDTSSVTIKLDGVTITGASITAIGFSYTPSSPLSDGTHAVYISVADTANNVATSTLSFKIDMTPPTISSPSPSNVILVNSRPTISATFFDATEVDTSSVTIKLDGVTITGASITAIGFSYTPSSSLSDGSHTVYISVADTLGNTGTSTWTFTVDTTPPTISLPSITNGSTSYVLKSAQVTINPSLSDNVGLNTTSISLKVDGVDVTSGVTITATGISYSTNMEAGSHVIQIIVSDNAGNKASSIFTFVMVDYTLYLILAIVAVVAIVVVLVLLRRKKHPPFQPTVTSPKPSTPPPSAPAPTPSPAPAQTPSKAYCFYCGAENSIEAIYCQKCGKTMPQQAPKPPTHPS